MNHAHGQLASRPWRALALLGVGVLLAAGLVWWIAPWHTARPATVQGIAYANEPRTAIDLVVDSRLDAMRFRLDADGEPFDVENSIWAGPGDTWRSAGPVECLRPGDHTRIELRFVEVKYGDGPGGPTRLVTSVRCLE